MSEVADAILDAAERRIRKGGFHGFSFREIAHDVGIKSSSVHYHFSTKETLSAAVIRRYTDRVALLIDRMFVVTPDPVKVWTSAFRETLNSPDRMCPCAVLGATARDLPAEVAAEVQRFFKMCLDKLVVQGVTEDQADQLLATVTGALVVANALNDVAAYDRGIAPLLQAPR
jgi:TetR/AcrR family transcriptional regulator, transcriptional repressor for nem operon